MHVWQIFIENILWPIVEDVAQATKTLLHLLCSYPHIIVSFHQVTQSHKFTGLLIHFESFFFVFSFWGLGIVPSAEKHSCLILDSMENLQLFIINWDINFWWYRLFNCSLRWSHYVCSISVCIYLWPHVLTITNITCCKYVLFFSFYLISRFSMCVQLITLHAWERKLHPYDN